MKRNVTIALPPGAIFEYAKLNNIEIVSEFYDAAVKGTDSLMERPMFSKMFQFMQKNNVNVQPGGGSIPTDIKSQRQT